MKHVGWAEWLLRRTTGREQASAEMGDLLEMGRGDGWVWRAVLGTVARRSWRGIAALVLAYFMMGWASGGLLKAAGLMQLARAHSVGLLTVGVSVAGAGATWAMLAVYGAVRYGVRHDAARVAAALTVVDGLYLWLGLRRLPWAGLAAVPVLAGAMFAQRGRWRAAVVGLLAVLPLSLVVTTTSWIGLVALMRSLGDFPAFAHHAGLRWWMMHCSAIESVGLSVAFFHLYRRWAGRRTVGAAR